MNPEYDFNNHNNPETFEFNSLNIDHETYIQIIRGLHSVLVNIESTTFQPEDLKFFEKASKAVLIDYWDKYDRYKGRIFKSRLKTSFRNQDQDGIYSKLRYYKVSLNDALIYAYNNNNNGNNVSRRSVSSIGTSSSHSNNNQAGFGSGDLVYSKNYGDNLRTNNDYNSSNFPKIESDIFARNTSSNSPSNLTNLSNNNETKKSGIYSSDIHEFMSALNNLKRGNGNISNNHNGIPPIGQLSHSPIPSSSSLSYPTTSSTVNPLTFPLSNNTPISNYQSVPLTSVNSNKQLSDEEDGNKVFKCTKCSLSFKRSSDLQRHNKTHLSPLPHICDNCGKSFARKDALKRHFGTQTCKRNKEHGTYLENLAFLNDDKK